MSLSRPRRLREKADTGGPSGVVQAARSSEEGKANGRAPKPMTNTTTSTSQPSLGDRLRATRNRLGLTLAEAAELTGTGTSTLSKIENGQMSPTYDILQKIVHGLKIDLVDLFDDRQHSLPTGRRSITRAGGGSLHVTGKYTYEALATELTHKRFFPLKATITARNDSEAFQGEPTTGGGHAGEEFVFVLSGAVELHTEYYAPARLEKGDSVYFDSGMRHALISVSEEDAEVLWIAS